MTKLIFGCGYVGLPMARRWLQSGHQVYALTRGRAAELRSTGIEPIVGDVLDPASLAALPDADTVLYAVGMDRSAGRAMRDVYVQGLANVLQQLQPPKRFIYISSTGVYGQTDGSEVNEASPTEPREESGQVVLSAEQTLRQYLPDAMILRFAGIYGPARLLRKQPLLNGEPFIGDADKWLNLIHLEDALQAIQLAENCDQVERLFNISDGTPVTRREFYTKLAELLQAPPARFEARPGPTISEPNRRVRPSLAQQVLGFVPQYPSYRKGLPASL